MTAHSTITLAIETSNPSGCGLVPGSAPGVALARGRTIIGVEPMNPQARHDDDLMPAIDRLARRCRVMPREIGRIAVSVGPGGFTGLRVAVVTGAMLARVSGARCVPVPTSLVLARRWPAEVARPARMGVALCAKGERVHTSIVETGPRGGPQVTAVGMLDAPACAALGAAGWIADAHLPPRTRDTLLESGATILPPRYDPAACAEASFDLPDIAPEALRPIYAREPEAVTLWNARRRAEAP
ncbi:MAG: tRNA (adenosine(37)-N6)-threonylcarbamoyltransferase complex dimerization subunit type 1 TsaB [Phycisphaerales bacterium]|nr:tRNA (adenosine(37)-N6)-threonylcarbamoyltransferase complex dimerization subunit type 1 TsaB [Phycisphaerales bacterium]